MSDRGFLDSLTLVFQLPYHDRGSAKMIETKHLALPTIQLSVLLSLLWMTRLLLLNS